MTKKEKYIFNDKEIDLVPWDGITPKGRKTPYDYSDLLTDNKGNVYYLTDNKNCEMWCNVNRLESHVHHLQQIHAR